jgi:hypothetical protein
MGNKTGQITKISGKIEDPENQGVLYLPRYFGNLIILISHVKSIYLKNIGHNHGNTSGKQDIL